MKPLTRLLSGALLLVCVTTAAAQNMNPNGKNHRELLRMGLYPPDLLMRQQENLQITAEQRKAIAALVRDFQNDITELQWSLPAEQQKLRKLLNEPRIESNAAMRQAEEVLRMESQFKLAHFDLLIAIKNELTPTQIKQINLQLQRRLAPTADSLGSN